MKLRTRLFLWVGIIFFLTFAASLYFETYTTDKSLHKSELNLRTQILALNEQKRQHIEEYLHVSLAEDQAQIDSLLLRIARDPELGATLFLKPKDLQLIAPAHSAFLFKNDKWIDFLQTTKNNELTSLMIPIDFPMDTSHRVRIDDQLSWVVLDTDKNIEHPMIGMRLSASTSFEAGLTTMIDELIEVDWGLMALFDPKALINLSKKEVSEQKHLKAHGIDYAAFFASFNHAIDYLSKREREEKGQAGWIPAEIRKLGGDTLFAGEPFDLGIRCLENEGEVLNNRIIQLLQRGDQAIMIASLASLFPTEEFGMTPFSPAAPKGIARFPHATKAGHLLLTTELFYPTKIFSDEGYLQNHPSNEGCEGVGNGVAVIAPPQMERVFIGNSLELTHPTDPKSSGYLTVGMDADELVQDLVLSVHQNALLVHSGRIVSAFDPDGAEIPDPDKDITITKEMLESKSGTVLWRGQEYYYLHMTPFKKLDLHFFVLELKVKAFSLLRSLEQGSRQVLESVSINMRIIAVIAVILVLALLHRVALRITKPITALAGVTEHVAAGRLENLDLPKAPKGRHDEIATLCNSFEQMVRGLQEKEKVKGVLNKVVSPQIAQEIMKGKVHLGGEERKVTVLFADIRHFTSMTANMPPQEVIEFLNSCMTKISHVIDDHGGVIDKYVGDEVMALFGTPLEKEDSTRSAVLAGIAIQEALANWNKERAKAGLPDVEMGVGIHTGVVLAGNMGAENRLNYTVLGSNVNLAARICSGAKPHEVLITKAVLDEPLVAESIIVEEMPPMEFKGFEGAFSLYSVKGAKNA